MLLEGFFHINSLHAVRLYIGVRSIISLRGAPIYRRSYTCSRLPALSEGEVPPSWLWLL